MTTSDPNQRYFLAEWYQPEQAGLNPDNILARFTEATAQVPSGGPPIQLLLTVDAPTDEVLYGVFVAESADAVAQACRDAGWPTDRITGDIHARICQ